VKRVVLDDFSGGAAFDGVFVSERQVADAKGFVLDDQRRLRSQPALARIGSLPTVTSFGLLVTEGERSYLVVTCSDNSIRYRFRPGPNTSSSELASAGWVTLNASVGLPGNVGKILGPIRWKRSSEYEPALLVHHSTSSTVSEQYAHVLFEVGSPGNYGLAVDTVTNVYPAVTQRVATVTVGNGGTGYTSAPTVSITGGGGSGATATATVVGGVVTGVTVTNGGSGFSSNPTVGFSGGGGSGATAATIMETVGASGRMPRASRATMWRDFLVLADIEWSAANPTALSGSNVKKYGNYLWVADPLDPSKFDSRYPVRVAEEGSRITDLVPVDEGLLVLSTSAGGVSGVTLLRGSPSDFFGTTPDGTLEPITGLDPDGNATFWPEQQSVLFPTTDNRLIQYRQGRINDLSPFTAGVSGVGTPTEDGTLPGTPDNDRRGGYVMSAGRFVILREDRTDEVYALRSYGDDGAWTKLNPGSVDLNGIVGHASFKEDLFFATSAGVFRWRFGLERQPDLSTERGTVLGSPVDLTMRTRTLGVNTPFSTKFWDKVGVRLTKRPGSLDAAQLRSVRTLGRDRDDQLVWNTTTLNQTLGVSGVAQEVVPGHGDTPTCEVEVTCRGDVTIDSVTVWFEEVDDQW
jgi:hypothetical protein